MIYKKTKEQIERVKLMGLKNKGKIRSEEHKRKLSEALKGRHTSPKTEFKKGHKVRLGMTHSDKTKQRLSEINKGKTYIEIYGEETALKKSKKCSATRMGHFVSDETKEKISKKHKGRHLNPSTEFKGGSEHPNWKGGKTFEPYSVEFNKELKEQIRKRDNHTCQECKHTQEQLGYTLPIHHIDYNKKNNKLENLISLCRSCHCQTNYKREDWTKYFKNKPINIKV